jgi:hypothetical protein
MAGSPGTQLEPLIDHLSACTGEAMRMVTNKAVIAIENLIRVTFALLSQFEN